MTLGLLREAHAQSFFDQAPELSLNVSGELQVTWLDRHVGTCTLRPSKKRVLTAAIWTQCAPTANATASTCLGSMFAGGC